MKKTTDWVAIAALSLMVAIAAFLLPLLYLCGVLLTDTQVQIDRATQEIDNGRKLEHTVSVDPWFMYFTFEDTQLVPEGEE